MELAQLALNRAERERSERLAEVLPLLPGSDPTAQETPLPSASVLPSGVSLGAPRTRALAVRALVIVSTVGLVGCGGIGSTLDPAGPRAARIADLTSLLTAIAAVIFAAIVALLLLVIVRAAQGRTGRIRGLPSELVIIVVGGIVLPAIVLPLLWAVTLRDMRALAEPPGPPELTIDVVGHQFGYLVRYPGRELAIADTIRIPVGRTVVVRVTSNDVIHSFWVPRLMEKVDMIPGRTNERWVVADRAGRYLLQCSEFCGLYHARMRAWIEALPPAEFDAWLRR